MPATKQLSDESRLSMYEKMIEIRKFEYKAIELYRSKLIAGYVHPSIGQEAVAVGTAFALEPGDYIATSHRGHGHCLAKGCQPDRMFAELLGRETGYCRGLGGSMHIFDLGLGILGANGIVAAGLPIAVGAALAIRTRASSEVVVVFFGEGASGNGAFHEAMNFASVRKLPVVFLCENNLYAISTHMRDASPVQRVIDRAPAYGMPGFTVDGNRVEEVYHVVAEAVARARTGDGPSLVEAWTYKLLGHSVLDPGWYRPKEEVEYWTGREPIKLYREELERSGLLDAERTEEIEAELERRIAEAVRFAEQSPKMDAASFFADFVTDA